MTPRPPAPTTNPTRTLAVAAQLGQGPDGRSGGRAPQVPKLWHAVAVGPQGPDHRALCGWQYHRQWLFLNRTWCETWKPRCPHCARLAA